MQKPSGAERDSGEGVANWRVGRNSFKGWCDLLLRKTTHWFYFPDGSTCEINGFLYSLPTIIQSPQIKFFHIYLSCQVSPLLQSEPFRVTCLRVRGPVPEDSWWPIEPMYTYDDIAAETRFQQQCKMCLPGGMRRWWSVSSRSAPSSSINGPSFHWLKSEPRRNPPIRDHGEARRCWYSIS